MLLLMLSRLLQEAGAAIYAGSCSKRKHQPLAARPRAPITECSPPLERLTRSPCSTHTGWRSPPVYAHRPTARKTDNYRRVWTSEAERARSPFIPRPTRDLPTPHILQPVLPHFCQREPGIFEEQSSPCSVEPSSCSPSHASLSLLPILEEAIL